MIGDFNFSTSEEDKTSDAIGNKPSKALIQIFSELLQQLQMKEIYQPQHIWSNMQTNRLVTKQIDRTYIKFQKQQR
jgi:hypothetical protein